MTETNERKVTLSPDLREQIAAKDEAIAAISGVAQSVEKVIYAIGECETLGCDDVPGHAAWPFNADNGEEVIDKCLTWQFAASPYRPYAQPYAVMEGNWDWSKYRDLPATSFYADKNYARLACKFQYDIGNTFKIDDSSVCASAIYFADGRKGFLIEDHRPAPPAATPATPARKRFTVMVAHEPNREFEYKTFCDYGQSCFFSTSAEALSRYNAVTTGASDYFENTHILLTPVKFPAGTTGYLVEDQRNHAFETTDADKLVAGIKEISERKSAKPEACIELKRALFNFCQSANTLNSLWENVEGDTLTAKYPDSFGADFAETAYDIYAWAQEHISLPEWKQFTSDVEIAGMANPDTGQPLDFPGFDESRLDAMRATQYEHAIHCDVCAETELARLFDEVAIARRELENRDVVVSKLTDPKSDLSGLERQFVLDAFSTKLTDLRLEIAVLDMLINQIDYKMKTNQLPSDQWGDDLE